MEKDFVGYRHGDLLIKKIDKLPDGVRKKKDNTLMLGEATNHSHRLTAQQLCVFEDNGQKFISLDKKTELVHEEHDKIVLEPGNYVILQEREFSPFDEVIQQVRD